MSGVTRSFLVVTGLLAGFCLLCAAQSSPRTLTLGDLRHEVTLADPQISPDGKRIALLVAPQDFTTDQSPVRIVMIDVSSGAEHTVATPSSDATFVRWSPSGDRIAYLASVSEGSRQLYVASPSGAHFRKLTDAPRGVDYYVWRPDGRAIGYAAVDPPRKRTGTDRFNTSFVVGDNDYLTTSPPLPARLWVVASDGGRAAPLTARTVQVPQGDLQLSQPYLDALIVPQHFPDQFFCWLDGGRRVAYTEVPDAYATHWDRAVIMVRDIETGQEVKLTNHDGLEAGCDASADGTQVAYWYPHAGKPLGASDIFVTSVGGGDDGTDVTRALDRAVWVARWMPGSRALLIIAHDGTREGMWTVSSAGAVRRLNIGDLNASAASVSRDGTIAFLGSGPKHPTELFVMRSQAAPRRLTDLNGYTKTIRLGDVKPVRWNNDGFDETGVLTYPPDYAAGKRYPLVLQIHGWPQYASQEAFDTDYPGLTQLFASHGYLVFEPNYRGSDDMGTAFESAIAGDTVEGPARDIMAGIAAVERLGIVDQTRIAVSGWSYGGQLTAWLIGHHAWQAAVCGAGPTDIATDYAISNYNVLDRYFYGGPLWASQAGHQVYVDQSPITYAWNITTPTLIMSTVSDTTVPVTHAYELYRALRDRGVPTQFVAYPSTEHYPSDPVLNEDIYRRWLAWLDRYLR